MQEASGGAGEAGVEYALRTLRTLLCAILIVGYTELHVLVNNSGSNCEYPHLRTSSMHTDLRSQGAHPSMNIQTRHGFEY